jgi:hypothetical protein
VITRIHRLWASALYQLPTYNHEPETKLGLSILALMANANKPYAYKHLENSDSIRLIELLPGVQGSWLTCNIIEAQRADSSEYEALSYAWGEPILSHKIEEVSTSMNLNITVNLHDALQAIRHEDASRVLWIDAICINQSDLDEKGHQWLLWGRSMETRGGLLYGWDIISLP